MKRRLFQVAPAEAGPLLPLLSARLGLAPGEAEALAGAWRGVPGRAAVGRACAAGQGRRPRAGGARGVRAPGAGRGGAPSAAARRVPGRRSPRSGQAGGASRTADARRRQKPRRPGLCPAGQSGRPGASAGQGNDRAHPLRRDAGGDARPQPCLPRRARPQAVPRCHRARASRAQAPSRCRCPGTPAVLAAGARRRRRTGLRPSATSAGWARAKATRWRRCGRGRDGSTSCGRTWRPWARPCLGDALYGGAAGAAERPLLHAHALCFPHPATGERMTLVATGAGGPRAPVCRGSGGPSSRSAVERLSRPRTTLTCPRHRALVAEGPMAGGKTTQASGQCRWRG